MIWGGFVALVLISSAQSATLWDERVAQWLVGAYSNEQTGSFNHCAASASYKSGVLLVFYVGADYSWAMTFANLKWSLKPGNEYSVRYWIDTNEPEYAMAVAKSTQMVDIPLKDSPELFNKFRRGYTLFVSAQSMDFQFNLTDSSRVLAYLLECVKSGGRKPVISVATSSNPFAAPNAPAPSTASRSAQPSADAQLAAERAEATVVAANLMSELRINGFKILRPEEMPKGMTADAVWQSDAAMGSVTILRSGTDAGAVPPIIISNDAKSCKKAFASGSLPPDTGSTVTRLFTRCGTGSDAFIGNYLILPRRAGGLYVIGTYTVGEEEASKALDAGIRQAVFRALPK
jgi:hypothetical protein